MTTRDCYDLDDALLPIAEAKSRLRQASAVAVGSETIPLSAARGRVLARPLIAERDVPSFDNVAVDGWAFVWCEAMASEEVSLPVVGGRAAAGHPFEGTVPPGHALRVLTGAVMPEGCDSVALQEETQLSGDRIRLPRVSRGGANRRPRGEDMRCGEVVLGAGSVLRPQDIGAAALMGHSSLDVRERLAIALLSTGDEIAEPGEAITEGRLHDANRPILRAQLDALPVVVTDLGRLPDDQAVVEKVLREAAESHHVIITSGGASRGDEDHLARAIEKLGSLRFWRIAIKPGRPLAFGSIGTCRIMGLPGNPVAASLCFAYLARPLIMGLAGADHVEPRAVPLPMSHGLKKRAGRTELVRVRLIDGPSGPCLERVAKQGSGVLTSLVQADGVAELSPEITHIEAGDLVPFLSHGALGLA